MVQGDFTLRTTAEIEAAIALAGKSIFKTNASGMAPYIQDILAYAGFETSGKPDLSPGGILVYSGWFSGKWFDEVDSTLKSLAEFGVGFTGDFRGEEGATWTLRASLGGNRLIEESLIPVASSELDALRLAKEKLAHVQALAQSDITLEQLREALI